ncbi:hypothetical protein MalM25_36830 [Planctomycetes bacterium MalM25]|nr:hypothetical protein MalM25_36830 [Planctomycetes bacterium MalM25]
MPTTPPHANESIALVGAGVAGLAAARELARAGRSVAVFDKGRGVGGRAATRRGPEGGAFDHGAQYFTARDERFATQVADWIAAGAAAEWEGRIGVIEQGPAGWTAGDPPEPTTRYVGAPGMNAIGKALAEEAAAAGAAITSGVRVAPLKKIDGRWQLTAESGEPLGDFDRVLVTAPAPQAAELLMASPALSNAAKSVRMNACWAVMTEFETPLSTELDGAFVNGEDAPLSWAARDSSKPGRATGDRWVLHGAPQWTEAHLDLEPEEAAERLLAAWLGAIGAPAIPTRSQTAHLWRYSGPATPLPDRVLHDESLGLYAGGDWCGGPRVEGAYLSGLAAAARILAG